MPPKRKAEVQAVPRCEIEQVLRGLGILSESITSIYGSKTPDHHYNSIHDVLFENVDRIQAFLAAGFRIKHFTSMLNKSGAKNHKASIEQLLSEESINGLKTILATGKFTVDNLSSMLHGAGAKIEEAIHELVLNKDVLIELVGVFEARKLSSMLNGAGTKIGGAIKALVENPAIDIADAMQEAEEAAAILIGMSGAIPQET